jgi:hypothetical protein
MNSVNSLLGPRAKEVNILGPRIPRSQAETDIVADMLVSKLGSPEHRPFYLRTAWRLNQDTINRHVASALELGKNPRAYFIALVKREKTYYE